MFAIVDIEGSGGSPKTARIIEIAIIVHNGKRVIEEYSTLVNPEQSIDPFVVALTGISDEMVSTAPTFAQIVNKVDELTKGRIFVAHNSRFDYGFIRNEYKRLGKRFQRKNLCTVNMSKKLLPGHNSYSLGKLCDDLDIPIKNRHRALGDAAATTILLEKMLFSSKKGLINELLNDELNRANLPPQINEEVVNKLPEETGVYYFLNQKGQPIYIGKSKNIRKRVIQHFHSDKESKRFLELKQKVHDFDVQLTGSELISEIIEAGEIKRFMPEFNRAQRRKKYRHGIFIDYDDDGYGHLTEHLLHPDRQPVLQFTRKRWAEQAISKLNQQFQLTQDLRIQQTSETYNERLETAIASFHFDEPNFILFDEGRHYGEQAVILIKNGLYYGYEFISNDLIEQGNMELLLDTIPKDYHSPDKDQIIRKHLRKKKKYHKTIFHPEEIENF